MKHAKNVMENQGKKGAAVEVYGFVAWLVSFVLFGMYCLWAFLPDSVLHAMGISYYPSKYWALAIPIFIMVLALFVVLVYISYNLMNTAPLDSIHLVTDEHATYDNQVNSLPFDTIPHLADIPIEYVNEMMYRNK